MKTAASKNKLIVLSLILCAIFVVSSFFLPLTFEVKSAELGSFSGGRLLEFESVGNDNLAVLNSSLIKFSSSGVIYNQNFGFDVVFAALKGNSLYVIPNFSSLTLYEYSVSSGTLINSYSFGTSLYSIRYITIDSVGNVYIVNEGTPNILNKYSSSGLVYAYDAECNINLVDCVNDTLYIHTDESLLYGSFWDDPSTFNSRTLTYTPAVFLSNYSFISASGKYVVLSGSEILMYSGAIVPDKSCTFNNYKQCFYAEGNKVYASFTANNVSIGGTYLDNFHSYKVEGNVLGVNSNGTLYSIDGKLIFKEHETLISENTPIPTPSASPTISSNPTSSPSSVPSDINELINENDFIILNSGDKASYLENEFGLTIYNESGNKVSGNLKTGMYTEKDGTRYYIVIKGDVNGSGTVNTSDVSEIQKYIIGKSTLNKAYKEAADFNGDSKIDTLDLYFISKLIFEN